MSTYIENWHDATTNNPTMNTPNSRKLKASVMLTGHTLNLDIRHLTLSFLECLITITHTKPPKRTIVNELGSIEHQSSKNWWYTGNGWCKWNDILRLFSRISVAQTSLNNRASEFLRHGRIDNARWAHQCNSISKPEAWTWEIFGVSFFLGVSVLISFCLNVVTVNISLVVTPSVLELLLHGCLCWSYCGLPWRFQSVIHLFSFTFSWKNPIIIFIHNAILSICQSARLTIFLPNQPT